MKMKQLKRTYYGLLLALLVLTAFGASARHEAMHSSARSAAFLDDSLDLADTTAAVIDTTTLGQRAAMARLDSLQNDSTMHSATEYAMTQHRDTTIAVHYDASETKAEADTTSTSQGIDAPVEYSATDSLVYDMASGNALLFGAAKVHYQNMDLDAERIVMNMDSSLVHANGVRDTLDVLSGTPIYKQGSETYESEEMSFNFKTKKGYITDVKTAQGEGYLQSNESKRMDDGMFYVQNAKYTTCDADHPHFYLKLTKGKINPGKETFFGDLKE